MTRWTCSAIAGLLLTALTITVAVSAAPEAAPHAAPPSAKRPAAQPAFPHQALLNQYCVTCHNRNVRVAGVTLDRLEGAPVGANAQTWEAVLRKVRTGTMPPAGAPHPPAADLTAFAAWLYGELDLLAEWNRKREPEERKPYAGLVGLALLVPSRCERDRKASILILSMRIETKDPRHASGR